MRQAKDVKAFVEQPVGACVGGAGWLVCCPAPSLMALVAWDNPSRRDAERVMSTFRADLRIGPHAYFIDARRMTAHPDADAFAAVVERHAPHWERYRGHVTRCAIVLPPGMAAAVVVGFFSLLPPPFETKFFADPIPALEWAGASDAPQLLAALDGLQEETSETPALLFRLRAILDGDLGGATAETVARELRISTRSLQRRLVGAGTSYRDEMSSARLRKAQRLLAGTDLPIIAIALEVGCGSSQHLSTLFRRLTGESPSAWRATHRSDSKGGGA